VPAPPAGAPAPAASPVPAASPAPAAPALDAAGEARMALLVALAGDTIKPDELAKLRPHVVELVGMAAKLRSTKLPGSAEPHGGLIGNPSGVP
jgi:hypothetical protein